MPRFSHQLGLVALVFSSQALAQNTDSIRSANPLDPNYRIHATAVEDRLAPPDVDAILTGEVILDELKAIVLWPDEASFESGQTPNATGVVSHVDGVPESILTALQVDYLNQPLTFPRIGGIELAIQNGMTRQTDWLLGVVTPEQNITSGVLNVIVSRSRLGEVRIEGNQHFPAERYANQIRTAPGETISRETLVEDLSWLTRNPYRKVISVFQPGEDYGTSDILVKVDDKKPWTVTGLFDNNGVELLGEERIGVAIGVGDLITPDSQLFYQYLADTEFDQYHAHFASLRLPLPWRHELMVSGYYADSRIENLGGAPGFDVSFEGQSWLGAIDYAIILSRHKQWNREIFAGFDAKNSENNLEFGQLDAIDSENDIYQFRFGYRADRKGKSLFNSSRQSTTRFSSQVKYSPGNWSTNNSSAAFETIRAGADANYWIGEASVDHRYSFGNFLQIRTKVQGQITDGNVLPSEQLSLAGPLSVRGFDPNAVRADRGATLNHEIGLGSFSIGSLLSRREFLRDQQAPFAFIDYGLGDSVDPLPDEETRSLASAGLGWRMAINQALFGEVSYGWQFHQAGFEDDQSGRLNARITIQW